MTETPGGPTPDGGALLDPGPVRNTLLQLASQLGGAIFGAGLTLFLVRKLGTARYGIYALAVSTGTLVLWPAGLGLPWSVSRFLADHRRDIDEMRAIFKLGLRLQAPAAAIVGGGLFAAAGAIATAYGHPRLAWPLRWMAVAVAAMAIFAFLAAVATSVRRTAVVLWMSIIESVTEASTAAVLVLLGAGAAGATLGRAIAYSLAIGAGLYMTRRLLGGLKQRIARPAQVGWRNLTRYAGTMLIVEITWGAIVQIDVLMIGALFSASAVGNFGAVTRILTILTYLGTAVAAGVAPRMALGGGDPDTKAFAAGLRHLIILQGLVIAPMLVWAQPLVELLLGHGYLRSVGILRALTLYYFVGGPTALLTLTVTYLGAAARRVMIMLATLVVGLLATYVLLRLVGVVGAAIGDDLIQVVYTIGNLWLCNRLISLDLRGMAVTLARTLVAAAGMGLTLFAFGTTHLSVVEWLAGGSAGLIAFVLVLLLTRELSPFELRDAAMMLRRSVLPARRPSSKGAA